MAKEDKERRNLLKSFMYDSMIKCFCILLEESMKSREHLAEERSRAMARTLHATEQECRRQTEALENMLAEAKQQAAIQIATI